MQSNFKMASTDMIWNIQCREIAHQLEVTLSYCQRLCEFHHIAYWTSSAKLFAQISIIDALFKACRRKVDKRNSGIRTRGTFWVGRSSHKLLLSGNVEQVWPGQALLFIIIIIIIIIIDQVKKERSFVFYTTRCLKVWASNNFTTLTGPANGSSGTVPTGRGITRKKKQKEC